MSNEITPTDSVCPVYLEPRDEAQVALDKAEATARKKALADRAAAKQIVLDKLGLTADEIAALLS